MGSSRDSAQRRDNVLGRRDDASNARTVPKFGTSLRHIGGSIIIAAPSRRAGVQRCRTRGARSQARPILHAWLVALPLAAAARQPSADERAVMDAQRRVGSCSCRTHTHLGRQLVR